MWDIRVITDRTIPANRPDVALHDKKENTCLLIDIATPSDSNINTKDTEKLSKYKDLDIEVSRMREVRTGIVPVIIGLLGTIKKRFYQNTQLFPGNPSVIELQKNTVLRAVHIIRDMMEHITLISC
jgi:hypothetical protein